MTITIDKIIAAAARFNEIEGTAKEPQASPETTGPTSVRAS